MKKLIFLTSFLIIATSNAIADSKLSNSENKLPELQIFSLSKKNERAFDAASSIYIVSSEDIRRSGATSIPEALRLVPGLQVARIDGHKWAISSRGFNRQFSNKLLIMVDGRTIYTPVFSGAFWDVQDYPLADIEKIEVIRGSGGAIWGANAVNGIINIITKHSIDTQGGYATITAGNQDNIASVRYGGETKKNDHYRLYASQRQGESLYKANSNIKNDDGYNQSQAGFRYDIRSITNSDLTISGDVRSGEANNYFDFWNKSNNQNDKTSQGGNLLVNWQKTISSKSSFTLKTYLDYDQFDMAVLKRDGRTADIDFQHFYSLNDNHQLAWGFGYRVIKDQIRETALNNNVIPLNYTHDNQINNISSGFLQDKITLLADKAYLTIGSKFEHNNYTGFEYQPSAKISFYPAEDQTFWASVSRSVRTPTRTENGSTIKLPTASGIIPAGYVYQQGSNKYDHEHLISYEIGYRIKPSYNSLIDIALFYNDYSKLRTWSTTSNVAQNFGEGESFGGEFTAKWKPTKKWKLEAGYDFLKINLRVKNGVVDNALSPLVAEEGTSPKNQFRLRSNYNITQKIEFDNIVYYVDYLSMSGSSANPAPSTKVPAYVRFDTRFGYMLNSNIDLSIGVQNITDRRHKEFRKGLFSNQTEVGRTAYFKTTIKF